MTRYFLAGLMGLVLAWPGYATDPVPPAPPAPAMPSVSLPATIQAERLEWFVVSFKVNGGQPRWSIDPGLTEIDMSAFGVNPATATAKVFKGTTPGTFRIIAWNAGIVNGLPVASDWSICTVTIAGVVPPSPIPPGPGPKPPDPPAPNPPPIPDVGLHVLIIEETSNRSKLTAGQLAAIQGRAVRDYLDAHCAPEPKGKAYRIWDQNVSGVERDLPVWQNALKRRRDSVPWLIVSNPQNGGGYEGPLPASLNDTLKLLKKFGGE